MAILAIPAAIVLAIADKFQVGKNPAVGSLGRHIGDAFDVRKVEEGRVRGLLSPLHPVVERVETFALKSFAHCISGFGRLTYQVELAIDHLSGNHEKVQREIAKTKFLQKQREELLKREERVLQVCATVLGKAHEEQSERAQLLEEGQQVVVSIDTAVKALPHLPSVQEVAAALGQFGIDFKTSFDQLEELVNYEAEIEKDLEMASRLEMELIFLEAEYGRVVEKEERLNAQLGTIVTDVKTATDDLECVMKPQAISAQSQMPAVVSVASS